MESGPQPTRPIFPVTVSKQRWHRVQGAGSAYCLHLKDKLERYD